MEEGQRLLERILDGAEDPTDLPLALLQYITNDFSEENKIGQGGFGAVYKGVLRERVVAVKRIHINENTFDDRLFRREFASLWKTNHRNVVRFLGFCSNTYQKTIKDALSGGAVLANVLDRLLCFEYICNGSLDKHITDELRGLEWETRYEIVTGICKGLRYLHEDKNIIHMDLKPANILLHHQDKKYMVPKITDFGLSRPNENSHTVGKCYGTRGYLAPEYENQGQTSFKADIYSLGLIIIELVTGCKDISDKHNVLRRWRHRWNKPPTQLQYQQVTRCIDLAGRCREQKPEARPSVSEIISFLSESERTYDQISSRFDEDDMLRIKPLELRLNSELKNETSHSVELTNGTRNSIAFKIQLPSIKYIAQPEKGIVQPESKYGVKITVKPRDSDDVEKFIVKSMKVSQVLIDKDITESMFEEAGKAVDEVNLMVVYEPTKSLENSKSKEDAKIPVEEVPEVINCMGQPGFVRSNLHLTQAYIKGNHCALVSQPTNQQAVAMNLVTGAMGSLLPKLAELLKEEYKLKKAVKEAVKSLEKEMKSMHAVLRKVAEVPSDQLDEQVRLWAGEVRELSFDMEDVVDKFLVHFDDDDSEPATKSNRLKQLIKKMAGLFNKGKARHQIADAIKDINRQVQDVTNRWGRYTIGNVVASISPVTSIDPRLKALYTEVTELVGIVGKRDQELMNLLSEGDDETKKKLKIISVIGFGGLGKTTLVKTVYDKIKGYYSCRAFVPVGRNADAKKVLMDILLDLGMKGSQLTMLDERQLINKLRESLENKRYLIVIDDIWDEKLWRLINWAFSSSNNFSSRVITTTRKVSVSKSCSSDDSVYQMEPLSDDDSQRLFYKRIFSHESGCPREFEELSMNILKKCGGVPLAIITIASLLVSGQQVKPEDECHVLLESIGRGLTEDPSVEEMLRILSFSYYDLPSHLKTCLLYLSMFPEDWRIEKDRLIWMWIVESFVQWEKEKTSLFEIGETYFNELVNRNMIMPVYGNEGTVVACKVHDMVLDLIVSLSSQDNFVTVLNGIGDGMSPQSNVRRLSLQNARKRELQTTPLESVSMLHVRSVVAFETAIGLMPPFSSFVVLRVLELKGCEIGDCNHLNLRELGSLLHLRYLGLAATGISELPEEVGKLQFLQVLDLRANDNMELPSTIIKLRRLMCLLIQYDHKRLPDGLGNLTSMEVLHHITDDTLSIVKELGNMERLRKLVIRFENLSIEMEEAFVESLGKMSNIQDLTICYIGVSNRVIMDILGEWWVAPRSLRIFVLDTYIQYIQFSTLPAWIRRNPSNLPSHLKTCLLYLSMFPEDWSIVKDRLIWMWIAESFVQCEKEKTCLFEIGETYFNELVNRNMIMPVYGGDDDQVTVVGCKVHDMVLDLIVSLSSQDNFVTVLNGLGDGMSPQSNVRRLSLQNARKGELQTTPLESESMLQVRSVAAFEPAIGLMPSFSSFVVLRVLELNGCDLGDHNHLNLRELGSLLHLRYLGLGRTKISELPEEVGKLQFLQVLDLSENDDMELPSTIIKLRRLMCLLIDSDHKRLPEGLGNLTSMEVLYIIAVDSLSVMKELGSMERLRKVSIVFDNLSLELEEAFVESLGKMSNIQELAIFYRGDSDGVIMDILGERWVAPRSLRIFVLVTDIQFSTLPAWIGLNPSHLSQLTKLQIRVKEVRQEDLDVLGSLPALHMLSLGSVRQSSLLVIAADGFRCLTVFNLFSESPGQVVFQPGAMPKAEKVELDISLQVAKEEATAGNGGDWFDLGMGSLSSLRMAYVIFSRTGVTVGEARQAEAALKKALCGHSNRPGFGIIFEPYIRADASNDDVC